MKRWTTNNLVVAALLLVGAWSTGAVLIGAVRSFNEANAAYRQGRYEDAISLYTNTIAAGARSSTVYYNLGNAYFRTGKIGLAVLSFERSLRLDPGNDDARRNVAFVSSLLQDRIQAASFELRAQEKVAQILGHVSLDFVAVVLLLAICAGAGIGGLWLLGRFRTGAATFIFVACCLLAVSSAGTMAAKVWSADDGVTAVVLAGQANARFEPSEDSRVTFVIHEGTKIWLVRRDGPWAFVRLANGLRGWVRQDAFQMI